jgi:hypothetical protein
MSSENRKPLPLDGERYTLHTQIVTDGFVRELCIACEHRWVPERLYVIFTAYFDESGAHRDSPVLVLAAQLGTARQWELFERRLRALQREFGFTIFHAKEFKTKSGDFRGWSDIKRYKLLSAMTELVRDGLTEATSVTLETSRYEQEYRDTPRPKKMPLDSQYGVCFRNILSYFIRRVAADGKRHRLHVVLEDGHRNVGDACRIYEEIKTELREDFGDDLLGDITIATKTEHLPLMAADFLAYLTFSMDRGVRNGEQPYPVTDRGDIPTGQSPWTHIRLAPNAFQLRREQFEELQRRKAEKHKINRR